MTGIVRNKTLAIRLALAGIALGVAACSQHDESSGKTTPPDHRPAGEVYIKVSQPAATRTYIGGAGLDRTVWSELDKIGVYWHERGSGTPLNSQIFSYFREYADETLFSADVPAVVSGDYTYYGAYPVPASVSGTTVTYNLPAVQDGTYDMADFDIRDAATHTAYKGNLDFLIAEPVDAGSLTESEEVALKFVRQCHVLRIQVPTGRNKLGNDISKLRIEFPSNMVGTMTMDLADPYAGPLLSNGSSVVTADLRKPVSESDDGETDPDKYVWVFVCPGDINGQVTFTGYNVDGLQSKKVSVAMNKTLAAGRITPIDLTIAEESQISWINFSIGSWANLGENPNSFTVKAPEGVMFRNGRSEWTFDKNGDNLYVLPFYYEYDGVSFGNMINTKGLDIVYNTNNAIVSEHIAVAVTDGAGSARSLTVPYLFYEDFSGVGAFDNSGSNDGVALSELPGWTGGRVAAQATTRLRCTSSAAGLWGAHTDGRMDSPQLSGLKPGSSVKVKVTFRAGLNSGNGRYACGYVTSAQAFGGSTGLQNTVIGETNSGVKTNDNYTSSMNELSFDIVNCSNIHRASWRVTNNIGSFSGGTVQFYLDDVRATIVP